MIIKKEVVEEEKKRRDKDTYKQQQLDISLIGLLVIKLRSPTC